MVPKKLQNQKIGDIRIGDEHEVSPERGNQVRTSSHLRTFYLFSRGGSTASPARYLQYARISCRNRGFYCIGASAAISDLRPPIGCQASGVRRVHTPQLVRNLLRQVQQVGIRNIPHNPQFRPFLRRPLGAYRSPHHGPTSRPHHARMPQPTQPPIFHPAVLAEAGNGPGETSTCAAIKRDRSARAGPRTAATVDEITASTDPANW
ncbi:hypothetical protein B0T09DRAFT_321157 [Sordaria sp. MPI-SDFR-AT-0083]|nr:hypothetical protein B0T09DRAFT_321157 [Sordaria sp. MPI-SDFR-AT-0083]